MSYATEKLDHKLASLLGMLNRGNDWSEVPEVIMLTFIEVTDLLREQNKALREMSVEINRLKSQSTDRNNYSPERDMRSGGQGDPSILDQLSNLQRLSNSRQRNSRSRAAIVESKNAEMGLITDDLYTGIGAGNVNLKLKSKAGIDADDYFRPHNSCYERSSIFGKVGYTGSNSPDGSPTLEGSILGGGKTGKKTKSKGVRFAEEDDVHVYTVSLSEFSIDTSDSREENSDDELKSYTGLDRKKRGKGSKGSEKELVFVFENGDGTVPHSDPYYNASESDSGPVEALNGLSTSFSSEPAIKQKKSVKFRVEDDVHVIYDYHATTESPRCSPSPIIMEDSIEGKINYHVQEATENDNSVDIAAVEDSNAVWNKILVGVLDKDSPKIPTHESPPPSDSGVNSYDSNFISHERRMTNVSVDVSADGSQNTGRKSMKLPTGKRLLRVFMRKKPKEKADGSSGSIGSDNGENSDDFDDDGEGPDISPELAKLINALAGT